MNRTVRLTLRRTAEISTMAALGLAAVSSHAQETAVAAASTTATTLPITTSAGISDLAPHRLAPTVVRVDLEPELPAIVAPTAAALVVPAPAPKKPAPRPPAPRKAALPLAGGSGNAFAYGSCTWWVAHKRYVPWRGNAAQWWWNARAFGYAEGQTPQPGAIMVMAAGGSAAPQGHVAYVESVNGDGSFVVSEMNWWGVPGGGWGRVDYRRVTSMRGILGFIY